MSLGGTQPLLGLCVKACRAQVQALLPEMRTPECFCLVDGHAATELKWTSLRIGMRRRRPRCLEDKPRRLPRGKRMWIYSILKKKL